MQTKHLCVLMISELKGEVGEIFLLTVPRWYFFCESFVLFMTCVCYAFASVHCCLVVTSWERTDLLALVFMFIVFFLLSHMVSWARCGTWLYCFLIFAFLITLIYKFIYYHSPLNLHFYFVFLYLYLHWQIEFSVSNVCFTFNSICVCQN